MHRLLAAQSKKNRRHYGQTQIEQKNSFPLQNCHFQRGRKNGSKIEISAPASKHNG